MNTNIQTSPKDIIFIFLFLVLWNIHAYQNVRRNVMAVGRMS
nr:hypothetical protein [uncultured archaeon]